MPVLKTLRIVGLAGLLLVATTVAPVTINKTNAYADSLPTSSTKNNYKPVEITKKTFKREVLQSKLPVMVDFYSPWCGPCIRMKPYVNKMAKKYHGKIKFGKYNVKTDHTIPKRYNIGSGLPHLLFFHKGKLVSRAKGFQNEKQLDQLLKDFLKKTKKPRK